MGKKKRKSSFHGLKAYISYACIYNGTSYLQCGRDKEKGQLRSEKLRIASLMTAEIIGARCQTCQEDETNHHLLGF